MHDPEGPSLPRSIAYFNLKPNLDYIENAPKKMYIDVKDTIFPIKSLAAWSNCL